MKLPIDKPKRLGYNVINMKDEVTVERLTREQAGLKWGAGINPKYWEMKKAQQEKWAKEDAEKVKQNEIK